MHLLMRSALFLSLAAVPTSQAWQPRGSTYARDDQGLIIQTSSGEVHGFVNSTTPDVRTWLGIPYAEPPLGYLRFASPVPKSREVDPIYATEWKPSCMQTWSNSSTVYTEEVPQFLISGSTSEDCLYVNIWAPKVESLGNGKVPVFVYIPGGGFTSGGAHSYYKIPDKLVQARQDVVFVVMNYRVNVFGYPNANGLDGKNPGLLDQRMVVEWTRDNIAAFGGDPERITLWGQSAGGSSVDIYSYAWYQDPIVSGLVADSGAVGDGYSGSYHGANFSYVAEMVGCGGLSDSPRTELTCMQNIDAGMLENALSSYKASDQEPGIAFTPVADGVHVFRDYAERARDGKVAQLPMIMGNNANEGAGFVPFTKKGPGEEVLAGITESFACSDTQEAKNRALAKLPTYRYQYAGNFSNISPVSWMGAYHSSELPMVFGTHYEFRGNSTPFQWEAATFMQDLWLSFASDSSKQPRANMPDGSTFTWPMYQMEKATMAEFASREDSIVKTVSSAFIDDGCADAAPF